MDPFTKKRQVNRIMLEGLRLYGNPVAFFCECDRDDCYQAAWLTCDDYERYLAVDGWRALSDLHWEKPVPEGDRPTAVDLVSS